MSSGYGLPGSNTQDPGSWTFTSSRGSRTISVGGGSHDSHLMSASQAVQSSHPNIVTTGTQQQAEHPTRTINSVAGSSSDLKSAPSTRVTLPPFHDPPMFAGDLLYTTATSPTLAHLSSSSSANSPSKPTPSKSQNSKATSPTLGPALSLGPSVRKSYTAFRDGTLATGPMMSRPGPIIAAQTQAVASESLWPCNYVAGRDSWMVGGPGAVAVCVDIGGKLIIKKKRFIGG